MFRYLPIVIFHFYKAIVYYLFKLTNNKKIFLSGWCLLKKSSFRLSKKSNTDKLVGFRIYKRTLRSLVKNNLRPKQLNDKSREVIFASNSKFEHQIIRYVERFINKKIDCFLTRENVVYCSSFLDKALSILLVTLFSLPFMVISFFSRNRVNYALVIIEIVELAGVLKFVQENNITAFHDYNPYEIDSNLLALLLIKKRLYVYKYPSPGPLSGHNRVLIADNLVVSSKYHIDEIKHHQETFFVDKITEWLPEYSEHYLDFYFKKPTAAIPKTIGFYSTASWVRELYGSINSTVPGSNNEEPLIENLNQFLLKNVDYKLILFLHPKEKKMFDAAINHYNKKFLVPFIIGNQEKSSAELFNMVDVGVGVYSTILFERLFCGFKTLFFPKGMKSFPIFDSSLSNICPKTDELFIEKLHEAITYDTVTFFKQNNISNYVFFGAERKMFSKQELI